MLKRNTSSCSAVAGLWHKSDVEYIKHSNTHRHQLSFSVKANCQQMDCIALETHHVSSNTCDMCSGILVVFLLLNE